MTRVNVPRVVQGHDALSFSRSTGNPPLVLTNPSKHSLFQSRKRRAVYVEDEVGLGDRDRPKAGGGERPGGLGGLARGDHQTVRTSRGACGDQGIDSLSLNPDTVVSTWMSLAEKLPVPGGAAHRALG